MEEMNTEGLEEILLTKRGRNRLYLEEKLDVVDSNSAFIIQKLRERTFYVRLNNGKTTFLDEKERLFTRY